MVSPTRTSNNNNNSPRNTSSLFSQSPSVLRSPRSFQRKRVRKVEKKGRFTIIEHSPKPMAKDSSSTSVKTPGTSFKEEEEEAQHIEEEEHRSMIASSTCEDMLGITKKHQPRLKHERSSAESIGGLTPSASAPSSSSCTLVASSSSSSGTSRSCSSLKRII